MFEEIGVSKNYRLVQLAGYYSHTRILTDWLDNDGMLAISRHRVGPTTHLQMNQESQVYLPLAFLCALS